MPFACFSPHPDTFATLPRGVALAPDSTSAPASLGGIHRRASSRHAHPDPRAISSATVSQKSWPEADPATKSELERRKMRRVSKAMVGTPQEFVHRGHVGVDDLRRVSLDRGSLADISSAFAGLARPRPTSGLAPTVISLSPSPVKSLPPSVADSTSASPRSNSPLGQPAPPSRPTSPCLGLTPAHPQAPLEFGGVPEGDAEDGTAFGGRSRSPPPQVITRPLSPLSTRATVGHGEKNRAVKISEHKVKRKAAPVYVPSKIVSPPKQGADATGAAKEARDEEEEIVLPVPLDDKGRPMHFVGGHYMTNTTKFKFDDALDAIAKALG